MDIYIYTWRIWERIIQNTSDWLSILVLSFGCGIPLTLLFLVRHYPRGTNTSHLGKTENHLQKCLGMGYASFQECIFWGGRHHHDKSLLLMDQKSGNQLRLVVCPIIYRVLAPSQVVDLGICEPSTVCFTIIHLPSQTSKMHR